MMLYPGLTLESDISYTTFHNYHSFIAKSMGNLEGDRDVGVHYKYTVDKVRHMRKGKRFQKQFDLFITHDRSKEAKNLSVAVRAAIRRATPNVRAISCTDKA